MLIVKFVLRNIRLGARIEGLYRKDIYELPPDSIREIIINAVMNCSFLQSSHIQVAIYDDRLEITSPGGLMPGVTIDRMKEGYSQIRNRALAHAFSYMNLIEGWGTGIPRLFQEMKEYGLPEPEFVDMETALRINLYRALSDSGNSTDQETSLEMIKSHSSCEKIIYEISLNPFITQIKLAERTGMSRSGVKYVLKQLQNEGLLKRVGSTKKGQWIIKK